MADAVIGAGDDVPERPDGMIAPTAGAVRDEESLLRLYVGKNADKFAKLYQSRIGKGRWKIYWASFNWSAAIFGLPWFFYRKLYIEGAAILLIPIVAIYLIPALENVQFGISGILGAMANMYYLDQALKKIKKIETQPLPADERDNLIRSAGGTSIAGALLGAIILVGLVGLMIGAKMNVATLPKCDSEQVRSLVYDNMTERFLARNIPRNMVEVGSFEPFGAPNQTKRPCVSALKVGSETVSLKFNIEWDGDTRERFRIVYNPDTR